jgi:hypothetical protein
MIVLAYRGDSLRGRFKKTESEVPSPKDEPLSSLTFDGTAFATTIFKNQRVDNLPAKQASPPVKVQTTGIISNIVEGLMRHVAGATWACHRNSPTSKCFNIETNVSFMNIYNYREGCQEINVASELDKNREEGKVISISAGLCRSF